MSIAKTEYVSAGSCCAQILWLKKQLLNFDIKLQSIHIVCDNTSAINLTKNSVLHSHTKHIEIRHHFLHDHVEKGDVVFEHVDSKTSCDRTDFQHPKVIGDTLYLKYFLNMIFLHALYMLLL